jgi:hypothetical protein
MEHGGVDECGLNKFDRKYWRRFEAINQERKRKGEALMAEEREIQSTRWSVHTKMGGRWKVRTRCRWRPGAGSRMLNVPVRRSVK